MNSRSSQIATAFATACSIGCTAAFADVSANALSDPSKPNLKGVAPEPTANTSEIPKQILKTGVSLSSPVLAPNTMQLANTMGLTPVLEKIQTLRSRVDDSGRPPTIESIATRIELYEALQKAALIIQRTNLDIDFTVAEIAAEVEVYNEILSTYTSDRDKAVARTNAISFISNGALWAICEGLAIPGYKFSKYAIPSGIVGIPAGVIPSIASLYTFKQMSGKKRTSETEPNMLAKLFGYPTTADIEYPRTVWEFINQVPADNPQGKKRLTQLIDRWIADANMPAFTDRNSKKQLDVMTASVAQPKGLSIATLTARSVMLQQLNAEVLKMKRMLCELTMVVQGEKQITANMRPRPDLTEAPNPRLEIGMQPLQGVP